MGQVRWARPDDARAVALVHVDAWRAAYTGLIDQAILDALDVDQRSRMWRGFIQRSLAGLPPDGYDEPAHQLIVAEDLDEIVGWAAFGPGRDPDAAHRGEIAGLYAHPTAWSTGVGNALITCVEQELRDAGFTDAYLWVLRGNERAIGFYERHGWHFDGGNKIGDAGGATGLHELRHVRRLQESL